MPNTVDHVYRDFVTDGMPSSGWNEPDKAEIRALLNDIDLRANGIPIPNAAIFACAGASNKAGSDEADGGNVTTSSRVKAWDHVAGAWVTATRGVAPFKAAVPPYAASNSWGLQFALRFSEEFDVDVYLIWYAQAATAHPVWLTVANGGTSGLTNRYDKTQTTGGGTVPKFQTIIESAMASAEIVATGKTTIDGFTWDNGGLEAGLGVQGAYDLMKTFVDQVYAEDWMTATTPFICAEMPYRGNYGDVTRAWARLYSEYPYMGLIPTDNVPFTIDIYPTAGDVAHYSGTGHDEMADRALNAWRKLPHGNTGVAKNPLGGNCVLINAAGGAIAGESASNPYYADMSVDGMVYALTGTLGGSRQTTHVRPINASRMRNLRTTFHNYLEHGFRLRIHPPLKTSITLVSAVASAGNMICTYSGDIDPEVGKIYWFSGITWAGSPVGAQLNNGNWGITSLDTGAKTFIPILPDGTTKPVNTSWTNGTGGTMAEVIEMEDPRSGVLTARAVDLVGRETVTFETFGSSETAPMRVRDWNPDTSKPPDRDYRRVDNLAFNPQVRAGLSGMSRNTRSIIYWEAGDRNSGPYTGDSCVTLEDTGANINEIFVRELPCLVGDVFETTYKAKAIATDTVPPTSPALTVTTFQQQVRFYDSSGNQVGSDTSGTNIAGTVTGSWAQYDRLVATAPASAVTMKLVMRGTMSRGRLYASDFVIRRLPTLDDPFAWVWLVQAADSAALTSTTSLQQLFDTASAGAYTASEVGLYEMEGFCRVTSFSGTSGAFGVGLLGTATVSGPEIQVIANKGGGLGTPQHTDLQALTGVTAVVSASTSTDAKFRVSGIIPVTAAGTLIPAIKLGVAATPVLKAKSWWRFRRIPSSSGGLVMPGWS